MSSNLNTTAAYILRSAAVAVLLTAVTLGVVFASQPAFAEEKMQPVAAQTTGVTSAGVPDRMRSANRNAEAVRALL